MGDEELRSLERRWHETGEVEDEARWHLARVRGGALTQARLELASHVGHRAAVLATAGAFAPPATSRAARRWLARIEADGVEAARRAALAESAHHVGETSQALRRRLAGVEAPTPDDEGDRLLLRALRTWWEAVARWTLAPDDDGARARVLAAHEEGLLRDLRTSCAGPAKRLRVFESSWPALLGPTTAWSPTPSAWHRDEGELAACLSAVAPAIGPWALGLRDPLVGLLERTLERAELTVRCPLRWEALRPTADPAVRRCDRCRLDVLDLSSVPRAEAEVRLDVGRRLGGLCVTFFRGPDGRVLTADCLAELSDGVRPAQGESVLMGDLFGDV